MFDMAKSSLTTSTLSLGSCEKHGRLTKGRKNNFEANPEEGYVTRMRKRWTPQKCTSLENLTPKAQFEIFKRYELFPNIDRPVSLNYPKIHTIWKVYSKFIKGAWKKARSNLLAQSQKAYACELQERSALMQMSSLCAILKKDNEIMKDQTRELNELSNAVALLANDKLLLEGLNSNLNMEIGILIEDVRLLDQESTRKQDDIAQLEIHIAHLDKVLLKKEEKRDKYRIEMGIKRARVEQACKEYELNCEAVQNLKVNLKEVEIERIRVLSEFDEVRSRLNQSNDELLRETDDFDILKKKLAEMKDLNQVTVRELDAMQLKLVDQDLTVNDLENQISNHSEELDRLKVSEATWRKWDKLMYGMWVAACLVQVIRLVDRRWP